MASSQPSGVVRSQEMRERLPLSSLAWQVPHLEMTSASVTGMPSSAGTAGAPRPPLPAPSVWASAGAAAQAAMATRQQKRIFHGPLRVQLATYSTTGPGAGGWGLGVGARGPERGDRSAGAGGLGQGAGAHPSRVCGVINLETLNSFVCVDCGEGSKSGGASGGSFPKDAPPLPGDGAGGRFQGPAAVERVTWLSMGYFNSGGSGGPQRPHRTLQFQGNRAISGSWARIGGREA